MARTKQPAAAPARRAVISSSEPIDVPITALRKFRRPRFNRDEGTRALNATASIPGIRLAAKTAGKAPFQQFHSQKEQE
jgi:hypothetical protein